MAVLPDGRILLSSHKSAGISADAEMEGMVVSYEPVIGKAALESTVAESKLPSIGDFGPRRGRLEKLIAKPRPPTPPAPSSDQDQPLLQPEPIQSAPTVPEVPIASAPATKPTAARRRSSVAARAGVDVAAAKKETEMNGKNRRGSGAGRRMSKGVDPASPPPVEPPKPVFIPHPPPTIPPIRMEAVQEIQFYSNTTQPGDDRDALCNKHRRHWPQLRLGMYDSQGGPWIRNNLPVIRQMVVCPKSSRVLLACCGATTTAQGDAFSIGFLNMPDSEPGPTFQPILGGFASCIAVDHYENIILRSARGDGELVILWAKGTYGWVRRITDRAARLPIPVTPKEEIPVPLHETATQKPEVDAKVAEWSRALVSGAGWQENNTPASNVGKTMP